MQAEENSQEILKSKDKLSDIVKKIINILYINGDEISIKEIANILSVETSDVLEKVKEIENILDVAGLRIIINNEKMSINTHPDHYDTMSLFTKHISISDLTPAQLQTITIIAYLESLSVSQISFIRGIQSIQTIRALSTRGLIEKDLSKETSKDNYVLTLGAMQYMGISKNSDLKDFHIIQDKLKIKMAEALNG